MAIVAERVTLSPISEDPTLAPLDFVGLDPSWGIYLLGHEYPAPEVVTQTAGSADTEGDPVVQNKYGNRTISVKLRLVEPEDPAGTNLATNPVAALGTTSWGGVSLVSGPTRVSDPLYATPGIGVDAAIAAGTNAAADYVYHDVAVTNGKTYRASIYCALGPGMTATGARMVIYNAAGAIKKATGAVTATGILGADGAGWARLDVSFTADATATWRVGLEQVGAGAATIYAIGVMVEESANLNAFFYGDTPGCDWSGERHASTSTRPAPDGTRFSRIYRDVMRQLDVVNRRTAGTLRRIAPAFKPSTYDLINAKVLEAPQDISLGMKRAEVTLGFDAQPGGRTAEVLIATAEEKTLPSLALLAKAVPGDMLALGRLVLTDLQGQGQRAAWWGAQQRYYSSAVTAEPFYEAETRTPLGSTATAALAGASGGGNNTLLQGSLVNAYQGIMSTQASGGGTHLSQVGTYRVLVRLWRPTGNSGEVSLKLAWRAGDFVNVTENDEDEVRYGKDDREGVFTIADLGLVTLPKAPAGTTQRWEGRVLAKSTVTGDDIYVDWLMLVPTEEGSGSSFTSTAIPEPTSINAFDAFVQTAGALSGKAAGIGGNWSGAGDADDFTINTSLQCAQRTALSDVAGTPRYAILGTGVYSDIVHRLRVTTDNKSYDGALSFGSLARYIDINNWVVLLLAREASEAWPGVNANRYYVQLWKKVAGVKSLVSSMTMSGSAVVIGTPVVANLELILLSNGDWRYGFDGEIRRSGNEADFNTTGALKEGKVGMFDERTNASAETRSYDNLESWVPPLDQVVFANRSLEIRDNQVRREDAAGATWGGLPYEGNYLMVPPAGGEQAVTRLVAKLSRNVDNDSGIDDVKGQLYVQPRYLEMPPR